jgi:ATP-dependent Clp protease ATP-binding subunit ClpA
VILLDEIEKAHQDVYNILLQVMDHGTLTDSNGKKVDFRNVILIMTTNAGASEMSKEAIGFGSNIRTGDDEEAIKKLFTPEFRNRLDSIISFKNLSPEVIGRVVEKFILELEMQLEDRNVHITVSDEAKKWLADKGYDEHFGARPLKRVIQEHVKKPLANELLFGKLINGGEVNVEIENKKISLNIVSLPEKSPKKPPKPEDKLEGNAKDKCTDELI